MNPQLRFLFMFPLCLCVSVVQAGPPFYRDKSKLLMYIDADGKEQPFH
jgi:hypothetical protein